MKIPVLLFGSHLAAYGTIRGLASNNIPVYIVCPTGKHIATKSRFTEKTFILSPDDKDFVIKVAAFLCEIGGHAVAMVAGTDEYLDSLSKNIDKFPSGLKFTFSDWSIVSQVRCKSLTYQKCEELGIGYPKTFSIRSQKELNEKITNIEQILPVILKSEKSSTLLKEYGIKGILAHTIDEVFAAYKKYGGFYGELLLSEYIPGDESELINLIGVSDRNGNPIEIFMNRKVRISGEFRSCTLMEDCFSQELLDQSMKLIKGLKYFGYFNPEFKIDQRDGQLKLMEVNGRITLSNSHALLSDLNLPHAMYLAAISDKPQHIKVPFEENEKRSLWWEPVGDIVASFRMIKNNRLTVISFLKSLVANKRIVEPFWIKDPLVCFFWISHNLFLVFKKIANL